jgi:transposase InsO family protein
MMSRIAKPLNTLLEKTGWKPILYEDAAYRSFERLKAAIIQGPVLSHPDFSKPFILYTDACIDGVGACLAQIINGKERVIAFASRTLTKAERKWCVRDWEALAILWACEHFRPYLNLVRFTVVTDHASLKWLKEAKGPGRIARWALRLQEFDFVLIHRAGKKHGNADAMSRLPLEAISKLGERAEERLARRRVPFGCQDPVKDGGEVKGKTKKTTKAPDSPETPSTLEASCLTVQETLAPLSAGLQELKNAQYRDPELRPFIEYLRTGRVWDMTRGRYWIDHSSEETKTVADQSPGTLITREEPDTKDDVPKNSSDDQETKSESHSSSIPDHVPVVGPEARTHRTKQITDKWQKIYRRRARTAALHNGILYYVNRNPRGEQNWRLEVPISHRYAFMHLFHDVEMTAHGGITATLHRMRNKVHWIGMDRDVQQYINTCGICQRQKSLHSTKISNQDPKIIASPWHTITVDLYGPLPRTKKGNRYVALVVCNFLTWMILGALPTKEPEEVAEFLFGEVYCMHGCPLVIQTDQGGEFTSRMLARLHARLGITPFFGSTGHSNAQTRAERLNLYTGRALAILAQHNPDEWDAYLKPVAFAKNTSPVGKIHGSAFSLLYGRTPRLPIDVLTGPIREVQCDLRQYGMKFTERLRFAYDQLRRMRLTNVRQSILKDQIRTANRPDQERKRLATASPADQLRPPKTSSYEADDLILVLYPRSVLGAFSKMKARWKGPYRIVGRAGPNSWWVRGAQRIIKLHDDRIRQYRHRLPELENYPVAPTSLAEMLLLPRNELKDVSQNQMNHWLENTLTPLEQMEPVSLPEPDAKEPIPEPPAIPTVTTTNQRPLTKDNAIQKPRTDPTIQIREVEQKQEILNTDQKEENEGILVPVRADQDLMVKRLKKQRKSPTKTGREFLVQYHDSKIRGAVLRAWEGHFAKATPCGEGMFLVKWFDCWTPEEDVGKDLVAEWDEKKNRPRKRRRQKNW